MVSPTRTRVQEHIRWTARLAGSVLLVAGCLATLPGLAWGAPFRRGDVFIAETLPTTVVPVGEYSPSGQLVQTIPGTSGATVLCFDPASGDLIVPGHGLFGASGNPLPSYWGSITGVGRCVADGLGHVYASSCCVNGLGTISKYGLEGNLLRVFSLVSTATDGVPPVHLALAADGCTMYYGMFDSEQSGQLNVCTGSPGPPRDWVGDDVRVLPNGDVITMDDHDAALYDPSSGDLIRIYDPAQGCAGCIQLDTMSLDPDGTSFWVSSANPTLNDTITRFNIATGRILAQWTGYGSIAVYPGAASARGSGGSGGSGGTGGPSPSPSVPWPGVGIATRGTTLQSQLKALLSSLLVPTGNAAKIKTLLAHGGYKFRWTAPSAGRLTISWSQAHTSAHFSRRRTPVLVATVSRRFSRSAAVTTTTALTRQGKQLLKSARQVTLTAIVSFAPQGKSATTMVKNFTITR